MILNYEEGGYRGDGCGDHPDFFAHPKYQVELFKNSHFRKLQFVRSAFLNRHSSEIVDLCKFESDNPKNSSEIASDQRFGCKSLNVTNNHSRYDFDRLNITYASKAFLILQSIEGQKRDKLIDVGDGGEPLYIKKRSKHRRNSPLCLGICFPYRKKEKIIAPSNLRDYHPYYKEGSHNSNISCVSTRRCEFISC